MRLIRIVLFLLLCIVSIASYSQQINWALNAGNTNAEQGNTVATDAAGNVYVAGKFSSPSMDFGPGSPVHVNAGGTDGYVVKYNPAGIYQWSFVIGGVSLDEVHGIEADKTTGDVYITGYFRGTTIDFDPGPGTAFLTSNGDAGADPGYGGDIFLAKYSAAGAYLWAFNIGSGELYDAGIGISLDGTGNVYIGGYYTNTADFDPGPGTANLTSQTSGPIFLAKYTSTGGYQWAIALGSPVTNNSIFDIKCDPQGNVYTVGYYQGNGIDFDPGPGVAPLNSNGGYEMFLAKYNTTGQYQFAISMGGPGWDVLRGLALDGSNNVYVIGDFNNTVDFDPGPGVANVTSNGQQDAVVAKYTTNGAYLWAVGFGGTPNEWGSKVIVDGAHIFVSGAFSGVADLDPTTAVEALTSNGGLDIYLGKYSLNGEYICSFNVGGPLDDGGHALVSNAPNQFYLTGYFAGNNIDFDPSPITSNLTSNGNADMFLTKYTWPDNARPSGSLSGSNICVGEPAQLTYHEIIGTVAPYTITYREGSNTYTQTNVQPGVPFTLPVSPTVTTTYSLVSVKDGLRCSESGSGGGSTTVTVANCAVGCNKWLNTPSQGSKVEIGDLDVPGNQITVEARFNRTQPLNNGAFYGNLVSKHTFMGDCNYNLLPNGCEINTSNGGYKAIFQNCPLDLNTNYHVAMVYDGTTLKYYRDGFLLSQIPCSGNMVQNNLITTIGQVAGGSNPVNNQFLGYINEVKIWNVARTQAQLRAYMDNPLPNPTTQTGLLAYYVFDNLNNDAGPGNNGTATGVSVNQNNTICAFAPDSCEMPNSVIPRFNIPASVCAGKPVNITNTSQGATSYFWNFCQGSVNQSPVGTDMGNIGGQLTNNVFIDYAFDNGNWYGFVTKYNSGTLVRLDFGNSLLNTPTAVNLGNLGGVLPQLLEGIQIVKNQGKWYAIMVGGFPPLNTPRIIKVEFGANITNTTPVATNWGNLGNMLQPVDLHVFEDNGNWYGFTINAENNSITRFNFTNSFDNTPTGTNLGNIGNLAYPTGIYAIKNSPTDWKVFIVNAGNNTQTTGTWSLTRLDFGNSLLNAPTGVNLGNPGGFLKHPRDITIMKFCDEIVGFAVNGAFNSNDIVKIDFNNNLNSTPVLSSLGNTGNLNFPHSIAKIFRQGSDLYSFITNANGNNLTRIRFEGCTNASIPNSTLQNPPPIVYNTPGIYNISLTVDDGLPTQQTICKQLEVENCDTTIINKYTEVLALDNCANTLTVANAADFNVGDTVMIIQMKGAVIDSTNTVAFGNVTDLKNAGNYEYNYVKAKTGNSIELKNAILKAYNLPDGLVQLIRVPYFRNYTNTSVLSCMPWDGSKGGVLVFNVENTLTMGKNIDVSGKGFRGGQAIRSAQHTCSIDSFWLARNYGKNGSMKGEGIYSTNGRISGRGRLVNGGGGGNSTNSGGAGGGNSGIGGSGGDQYNGACGALVNGGIGGLGLTYNNTENRIFLGGGGGAGHMNDAQLGSGGNGGGIVIISAPTIISNNYTVNANGNAPVHVIIPNDDGRSGGGGGGVVLLNYTGIVGDLTVNAKGGNGDTCDAISPARQHGPGGGGGGGVVWINQAAFGPNILANTNGGAAGVNRNYGNDPWGAMMGAPGVIVPSLVLPVTTVPFEKNIDSVRMTLTRQSCLSFHSVGVEYVNTSPIVNWEWFYSPHGSFANSPSTTHVFPGEGEYEIKLIGTDANGCKDSTIRRITIGGFDVDFSYVQNTCNPLEVIFRSFGDAATVTDHYWDTGTPGGSIPFPGQPGVMYQAYPAYGDYVVTYAVGDGFCSDTIRKTININVIIDSVIITNDTTICAGTTKQLRSLATTDFCWTPISFLNNPGLANPVTSTPGNITYYLTSRQEGTNLVVNGNFTQGNTGFTSDYTFKTPPNATPKEYFVGPNPRTWNVTLNNCTDKTTGTGNMMMFNGANEQGLALWKQTVTVTPNTNYAFSTWVQTLGMTTITDLRFAINGKEFGNSFAAPATTCQWVRAEELWNSGNNTTVEIAILEYTTGGQASSFALDDISFAPTFIVRDSVNISVDAPLVRTSADNIICLGDSLQLNTTGAINYQWSPSAGLSNSNIANPKASPTGLTRYIVTGINANGCEAKDTVFVNLHPVPAITKAANTEICKNSFVQIWAAGGQRYEWSPTSTLNDPTLPNPTVTTLQNTTYYVTIWDANNCDYFDSVKVSMKPDPVFTINAPKQICEKDSIDLKATGGDIYIWQPSVEFTDAGIAGPRVSPGSTTDFMVTITESTCNISTTLSTRITVNALPDVQATSQRNLDCSFDRSQLNATGAGRYVWDADPTLSGTRIPNPIATPRVPTTYVVRGFDAKGCSNTDTLLVDITQGNKGNYLIPNAFTPNGDGNNDCFGIKLWGVIYEMQLNIYNRWGNLIFSTKDPNACWDGTFKGVMQNPDVYVYVVTAKTNCEPHVFRKGTFTLIR